MLPKYLVKVRKYCFQLCNGKVSASCLLLLTGVDVFSIFFYSHSSLFLIVSSSVDIDRQEEWGKRQVYVKQQKLGSAVNLDFV